jgi:hypothetical protein
MADLPTCRLRSSQSLALINTLSPLCDDEEKLPHVENCGQVRNLHGQRLTATSCVLRDTIREAEAQADAGGCDAMNSC